MSAVGAVYWVGFALTFLLSVVGLRFWSKIDEWAVFGLIVGPILWPIFLPICIWEEVMRARRPEMFR